MNPNIKGNHNLSTHIYENWKYDLNLKVIQTNPSFYSDLFACHNDTEMYNVLKKYYYISEPFDNLQSGNLEHINILKSVISISNAFTYKEAERLGADSDKAINTLIHYSLKIANETSKEKLLDLRTDMLITYYRLVKEHEMQSEDHLIRQIKKYIKLHLNEKIELSIMAKKLGYNKEYLSHYFSITTNQPLKTYIQEQKIKASFPLLEDTSKRIQDISDFLGYHDVKSYIRNFKKITNITPSQYRKQKFCNQL